MCNTLTSQLIRLFNCFSATSKFTSSLYIYSDSAHKAENRLISVTVNPSGQTTQFVYDGNGKMVKKIKPDGSRTIYVGGIYEVDKNSGGTVTKTTTYYPVGGAMRVNGTLCYMVSTRLRQSTQRLKDKLGSANVITDASGAAVGEARYYPYCETRVTTVQPAVQEHLLSASQFGHL